MMDKEEFIKYVEKINERIREKLKDDGVALEFYSHLVVCFNRICGENQKQKEVIDKVEELLIIKKTRCLNEDDYVLNVPDLDDILHLVKEVSE